ncbi:MULTISPECIES: BA14K family protein [Neorhizobium]|jgi:BA14K-like protein.
MRTMSKLLSAGAMSVMMFASSLTPAGAVMMPKVKSPEASAVEQVQFRRDRRDRRGWYHGHRGHREYRRGYRRHSDGFWYPLAAFGAGAIIGGAIANQPTRAYAGSSRHVQWCTERYRTYRASDNTYVPRVGVRAQCNSPYN